MKKLISLSFDYILQGYFISAVQPLHLVECSNTDEFYVAAQWKQYPCYMPQLGTLNYLLNVYNFIIVYGTLIKILSIFV